MSPITRQIIYDRHIKVEFVVLYSTKWTGINTQAVAVLLYSALMRRKVVRLSALLKWQD